MKSGIKLFKMGGSLMNSEAEIKKLISCLKEKIIPGEAVIIHGGGGEINRWLNKVGLEPVFIEGQRVTDDRAIKVVEMVLSGLVNKKVVSILDEEGFTAVGISGRDGNIAYAEPSDERLGHVGTVREVNPQLLLKLLKEGIIPVVSPLSSGPNGSVMNVNADFFASALASALIADELNLVTTTGGVLKGDRIVGRITCDDVPALIKEQTVTEGMIPKLNAAVEARKNGVKKINIINYKGDIGTCIL